MTHYGVPQGRPVFFGAVSAMFALPHRPPRRLFGAFNHPLRLACWLLLAGLLLAPLPAAATGQQDFWLLRPQGWQIRSGKLGGGMLRQYVEPRHNALVEVYAYKADQLDVHRLAELWEKRARQNKIVYVQQRTSSRDVTVDTGPAVLRAYQGDNQGHPIESLILYAINQGKAYVVVGVWAKEGDATLASKVRRCVTSLRFSDPTKSPQAASPAPAPQPKAASKQAGDLRRFANQTYGYRIAAPATWSVERESEAGNTLLMLRPPSGKAGLVVWAGKVDKVAQVDKLAAVWEEQAQTSLPALSQRVADCETANWPHLKQEAQLSCRRYTGVVNGVRTKSAVLYALRAGVGYVLMATYSPGQASVERNLRHALLSFRFAPLGQAASAAPRRTATQGAYYETTFDDLADWQGTAQRRMLRPGVARVHSQDHTTFVLKQQIPVEDVVVEWRGAGYDNGFHGHLGPYLFNIGGFGNSASGAAGPGVPWKKLQHGKVYEKGKFQIWRLERRGDRFAAYVDGKLIFACDIPRKSGEQMGRLTFTSFHSDLDLDWLRVMPVGATQTTVPSAQPPSISAEDIANLKLSASTEVLAKSPPMEMVLHSNLLFTGGINGMDPAIAAIKARHALAAPAVFKAIHALGNRLDFLHNASRAYDELGNRQYAYWYGLRAANPKYAFPYGREEGLMKRRASLQATEEILWVVINQIRLELGRVARQEPQVEANYSLAQCKLYLELFKRSLDLIDFYKVKSDAMLVPTAALRGVYINPSFGLPAPVVQKAKEFLRPEMDQASLIIIRILESCQKAYAVLQAMGPLREVSDELLAIAKKRMPIQYRQFAIQVKELRRQGHDDVANVVQGVMENYRVILNTPRMRGLARGGSWNLGRRLSRLLGPSVAHAAENESILKRAKSAIKKVASTVVDTANAGLEVYSNTTNLIARKIYGVEERSLHEFTNDMGRTIVDMHSRWGTGDLGQKPTENARMVFDWVDKDVIGEGFLPQAAINVLTLSGYGLGKDLMTINDNRASALDKTLASTGIALNFIPIGAVGGKIASGAARGTIYGGKQAIKSSWRVLKKGAEIMRMYPEVARLNSHFKWFQTAMKELAGKVSDEGFKEFCEDYLKFKSKAIARIGFQGTLWNNLNSGIKRGLTTSLGRAKQGFIQSLKGDTSGPLRGLWEAFSDGYTKEAKALLKEMAATPEGAGIAKGFLHIVTQNAKDFAQGMASQATEEGVKIGVSHAATGGQGPNMAAESRLNRKQVVVGAGTSWSQPQTHRAAGLVQNTWKLASLGPGAMRDKKKPVKRPVELIVDHSDTGEGFGTMTFKGQRNLLLQARIKYPRSEKCQYPRYLTGLLVQVLGPDGKSVKSAWGDVGDGWSGWSPGVSVSVAISPNQARKQPGLYTVVFTKKMNLTPESNKPVFQHKKMMAVSVLVKAEGDRCCVGRRKSVIRNQRYVVSCERSTLMNRIGKESPGGCDGLAQADYTNIYGPASRKKCEQYVKGLVGKGELGECFVGVKTDYQYMHALPCGRVLGTWGFSNGISAGFHANGTISGTYKGKWECLSQDPPKIMADWGGRGVALLDLSQNGKSLTGKDQYQRKLKGTFRKLPTGFKLFKVQCNAKKAGDALPKLKELGFKKVFGPESRDKCEQWANQRKQLGRE